MCNSATAYLFGLSVPLPLLFWEGVEESVFVVSTPGRTPFSFALPFCSVCVPVAGVSPLGVVPASGVVGVPIDPGRWSAASPFPLFPLWLSPSFTAGRSPCPSVCEPDCAAGVCESVVPWLLLLCDQAIPQASNATKPAYTILLFIFPAPGLMRPLSGVGLASWQIPSPETV